MSRSTGEAGHGLVLEEADGGLVAVEGGPELGFLDQGPGPGVVVAPALGGIAEAGRLGRGLLELLLGDELVEALAARPAWPPDGAPGGKSGAAEISRASAGAAGGREWAGPKTERPARSKVVPAARARKRTIGRTTPNGTNPRFSWFMASSLGRRLIGSPEPGPLPLIHRLRREYSPKATARLPFMLSRMAGFRPQPASPGGKGPATISSAGP